MAATSAVAANHFPKAPEWKVSEWINGNGATVEELKGKAVIIEFFQPWCPGCNRFSIPLMQHWERKYADRISAGDLVMVSIHTVFEGHDYQNPQRLKEFLRVLKGERHSSLGWG